MVYYQFRPSSPFSLTLLRSQLPHGQLVVDLGADCSPKRHCHQNSYDSIVLSNILSICLESLSSVRHFPDLFWIVVEDLLCFSEVRSFTSWHALFQFLSFLFRQVSISYPVLLCFPQFPHCLLNTVCFLVFFCIILLLLLHAAASSNPSSHQSGRENL